MSICFFNNEVSGVSVKCPHIPTCSHLRQWDHPVDRPPGIRTVATKSSITQKPDSQPTKTELVSLRSSTPTIQFYILIIFFIHDHSTHPTYNSSKSPHQAHRSPVPALLRPKPTVLGSAKPTNYVVVNSQRAQFRHPAIPAWRQIHCRTRPHRPA